MKIEQILPKLNNNDRNVQIITWLVADGEYVQKGLPIVEVESSKSTTQIIAENKGFLKHMFPVGATAAFGSVIAVYFADNQINTAKSPASDAVVELPPTIVAKQWSTTRLSKSARAMSELNGLNIETIAGRGLVTREGLAGRESGASRRPMVNASSNMITDQPAVDLSGVKIQYLTSEKVSKSKTIEIDLLTRGQMGNINSSLTVQFYTHKLRNIIQNQNSLVSLNALILYELAQLLKAEKYFRAFYLDGKIYFHDHVNMGIALDLGNGLKVAVISRADQKSPYELTQNLSELGIRYLDGELTESDLIGGTVTVSDLSGENILSFQPLLNYRQSVIFGIGGDMSLDGQPMSVTCTFDHRVLSGRDVGIFLNTLRRNICAFQDEGPA